MSKEFTIKVNGIDLKNDTLYQVVPKTDHDAPDGFIKEGTTKILSPNMSETVSCVFNERSNVWDTGFFENSPCYRGMNKEEVKLIVENLNENIVKPVEELLGEGKLNHVNGNIFWNELMINLKNGKVFHTANPMDLFHLYIAILHNNLAPKDQEDSYKFKKAKYCVVNKEEVVNIKQQREANRNKCIGLFFTLFSTDKSKLFLICDFVGLSSIDKATSEVSANSAFNQFLDHRTEGYQNIDKFLKAYELSQDDEGLREMTIYRDLKTLFRKGIIIKKYSEFYLEGESLGTNFTDATHKVLKNKDLENQVFELMEK